MSFLENLFHNNKANPYYVKLRKCLKEKHIEKDIATAYFLFGIPRSANNLEVIKKAIAENTLDKLRQNISYNVQVDNIELYLIEYTNNDKYIILLLDPYEIYTREDILEIIRVSNTDFKKEVIYS